jgi:hypothetical protein
LGYRSVNELLTSLSSRELADWIAYERVAGPIGDGWMSEAVASINELIQQLVILTAQDKSMEVQHFPRPHELHEMSKNRK